MERFMNDNSLFKTPGHHEKPSNIHLWKYYSQPCHDFNYRQDEWTRSFRCPMAKLCDCKAKLDYSWICQGGNYKQLEYSCDTYHDEDSHANDKIKKLK